MFHIARERAKAAGELRALSRLKENRQDLIQIFFLYPGEIQIADLSELIPGIFKRPEDFCVYSAVCLILLSHISRRREQASPFLKDALLTQQSQVSVQQLL